MGHGKSVPLLCVDFERSLRLQSTNLDEGLKWSRALKVKIVY
jgi:hypothetical protein